MPHVGHDWVVHSKIGRGSFSEIYSARSVDVDGGVPVAVKIDKQDGAALEWESTVLEKLQHTNIVPRHYKYFEDEEDNYKILVCMRSIVSSQAPSCRNILETFLVVCKQNIGSYALYY